MSNNLFFGADASINGRITYNVKYPVTNAPEVNQLKNKNKNNKKQTKHRTEAELRRITRLYRPGTASTQHQTIGLIDPMNVRRPPHCRPLVQLVKSACNACGKLVCGRRSLVDLKPPVVTAHSDGSTVPAATAPANAAVTPTDGVWGLR